MKPFESFLTKRMEEYIAYRQTLGYEDRNLRCRLLYFDQYVKENKGTWDSFNPLFFLSFRKHLKAGPWGINDIMSAIHGFFQFLIRQDDLQGNPLDDIPALAKRAYIPFIFSPEQIEQLLAAVQKRLRRNQRFFLMDLAIYLAFLFMARCGLRISEPFRLLKRNFSPLDSTIYIEKTKFNKDRLIPIPKSVTTKIQNYLAVRKSLLSEDQNPYLLAGRKQNRLSTTRFYFLFHQAVKDIGLTSINQVIANVTFGAPTGHSFRHSFAINTLKRIKKEGKSPQEALPILAAYMGHLKYQYTAVYLKVLDAGQRQALVNFAKSEKI